MASRSVLLATSCLLLAECVLADRWGAVQAILRNYFPVSDMAFSAGDATKRHFTFQKGQTNMSSQMLMASSSKFPAAMAIVASVGDGHLTLDTLAHEVFPWWNREPSDRRSRVTLRSLLSFTSGFYSPDAGGLVPCLGANASSYSPEACAREIYEQAPFEFEPSSTWSYNSFHLQVAGAMAATAAGISVQDLLHKYLIEPLSLSATSWSGGLNPGLAGNMVTTGDDYDKILRAYLGYKIVSKQLADEMERDYLRPPVQIANSSATLVKLLGHYSMCNYFECIFPKLSDFSPRCEKANIHVDAGLFGYYPVVDRARGTYMQVVQMKLPQSTATFFVPTISAMVLRRLVKGSVDQAIDGGSVDVEVGHALLWEDPDFAQQAVWNATRDVLAGTGLDAAEVWSSRKDMGGAKSRDSTEIDV
ncbi:unnamed protein product [Polarella glacialis]|uniref:Beta-lactamase-related domain-containing protein n=1 Tax=Polarella glacialis TaxID=89957 RepID=A0A813EX03_POLGL|nr:unnamed protein product [Polarella glacialis]CAE8638151.1 unnamed protein product [Polarella glacialis]